MIMPIAVCAQIVAFALFWNIAAATYNATPLECYQAYWRDDVGDQGAWTQPAPCQSTDFHFSGDSTPVDLPHTPTLPYIGVPDVF